MANEERVDDPAVTPAGPSPSPESAESPESPQSAPSPVEADDVAPTSDEAAEDGQTQLDELTDKVKELEDQLARSRADTYNVSQEYAAFVRRSKTEGAQRKQDGIESVIDTLLSVLDDIELARQHGDLDTPAGQIAQKLEHTLQVNFQVTRFGGQGDEFDPQIHEALMHNTSDEVATEQIGTLIQPGYMLGDKVLRPARVGVVSPQ